MLYILDSKVIFDPVNATLYRVGEKASEATQLTTIASKILHHLVEHHGELVTRDMLFNEVWEKAGIVASSNTLNQYISLLRKILAGYLDDKKFIVTVPRAGYYLSKDIQVSTFIHQKLKWSLLTKYFAAAVGVVVLSSAWWIYTAQPIKDIPRKIGELERCTVYDISGVKSDLADAFNLSLAREIFKKNNQSCTENSSLYIFSQESLHLHKPARVLFSNCTEWDDFRDTCQNIYYYTWVR
ncbi:TPA: transcriptional regulator [Enterobacter ludwigii]|nr:winged helix-turn-helix domain-containing protein [Enterobacter ludwigii]